MTAQYELRQLHACYHGNSYSAVANCGVRDKSITAYWNDQHSTAVTDELYSNFTNVDKTSIDVIRTVDSSDWLQTDT